MRKTEGSLEIYLAFCCVGGFADGSTGNHDDLVWPSLRDLAWVLAMGISAAVAQVAMTHALRDVRAVSAALILHHADRDLVSGAVFLAERLTPWAWSVRPSPCSASPGERSPASDAAEPARRRRCSFQPRNPRWERGWRRSFSAGWPAVLPATWASVAQRAGIGRPRNPELVGQVL